MKPLEKVLDKRKRQKQEKENDNANNTRSNSTGIVRENDKTEPREISQSSSLSDPERNGGYSTMATLGLSGAESRESRAIISANKEFQNINDEKYQAS
ncbi:hypothetical protein [Campylobacter coli]|uniref:hypothetical protein n=1 Tax=Campylobacter coli TaxID=195 RepID=UPI00191B0547|nr:hypothetical protein [Campylobacter coli]